LKDIGIENIQEALPSRLKSLPLDRNTGIRRAALNSRIEKKTVFIDKILHDSRRIGMRCANSTHAINHIDSSLN